MGSSEKTTREAMAASRVRRSPSGQNLFTCASHRLPTHFASNIGQDGTGIGVVVGHPPAFHAAHSFSRARACTASRPGTAVFATEVSHAPRHTPARTTAQSSSFAQARLASSKLATARPALSQSALHCAAASVRPRGVAGTSCSGAVAGVGEAGSTGSAAPDPAAPGPAAPGDEAPSAALPGAAAPGAPSRASPPGLAVSRVGAATVGPSGGGCVLQATPAITPADETATTIDGSRRATARPSMNIRACYPRSPPLVMVTRRPKKPASRAIADQDLPPEQFPIKSGKSPAERGSIARRRVQRGVFGAETYSSTLSTENVAMGPSPPRVSPAHSTLIRRLRATPRQLGLSTMPAPSWPIGR